jgi:hypothetical protein
MSKKVVIPKQNFTEMSIAGSEYQIRFRLVSEDRNRYSSWTPIFSVDPEVTFVLGAAGIQMKKETGYVSVVWDDVSIYKEVDGINKYLAVLPHYDVWIQLLGNGGANPSEWIYKGRIPSTSMNINYTPTHPYTGGTETTRQMKVEIYRPGRPVVQDTGSDFLMYSGIITTL